MTESNKKPRRAIVKKDYQAQYLDPIAMRSGDEIIIGDRDTENADWIWCTHPDGRSGWVHESFLSIEAGAGRASRDYSAKELTVETGEVIELGEERSGWVRATNSCGESGWLPAANLEVERVVES